MRHILLGFFLIFVVGVSYLSVNLGIFKEVEIIEEPYQELIFIFKDHIGPYHKIGDAIKAVEAWAKTNGVDCTRSFGQYIDDPTYIEHERLRSRGGCIVSQKLENLPEGIQLMVVPTRRYIIAKFGGSPWVGPYKVYSQVSKYALQKGLKTTEPVIEIYQLLSSDKMLTTYLFPI